MKKWHVNLGWGLAVGLVLLLVTDYSIFDWRWWGILLPFSLISAVTEQLSIQIALKERKYGTN